MMRASPRLSFYLSGIDTYQFIFPAAKANRNGMLNSMDAVAGLDALDQVLPVGGRVNEIHTGLIQRYRIKGCKDGNVRHGGGGGIIAAVAVNRQMVHHVDIQDLVAGGVYNRLGGLRHGFQKVVLFPTIKVVVLAPAVWIKFFPLEEA